MNLNKKKRVFRIILISIGGFVLIMSVLVSMFFTTWAKNKLISYVEENTPYHLSLGSVHINSLNSVTVTSIELIPKIDKESFNQQNRYRKDWITVKAERIGFERIQWKNMIFDKKINLDKLSFTGLNIYVYRDLTLKDPQQYKPLPSALLMEAGRSFTIPEIIINEGKVTYEERPRKGTRPGKVWFSNLTASLLYVSSDQMYINQHPEVILKADALFMDSAETRITYKARTDAKNGQFTLEGTMSSMSATILNESLTPLARVKIKRGYISGISFLINADEDLATGKMDIDYSNLEVEVVSADRKEKPSLLKTFVANVFVKDKSKPVVSAKETDRKGTIRFERKKNRSIFNYWWNAFKSGILTTITGLEAETLSKKSEKGKQK